MTSTCSLHLPTARVLLIILPLLFHTTFSAIFTSEEELQAFLEGEYETNRSAICNKYMSARWDYMTDIGNTTKSEYSVTSAFQSRIETAAIINLKHKDPRSFLASCSDLLKKKLKAALTKHRAIKCNIELSSVFIKPGEEGDLDNAAASRYFNTPNKRIIEASQIEPSIMEMIDDILNKTQVTLERANSTKYYWENYFKDLDPDNYTQEIIRRQVRSLVVLGTAALDEDKLSELTSVINEMNSIYSTAKICPYTNQNCNLDTEGLSLEPDIEDILSNSTDYYELLYVWDAWRNASGAQMKDLYPIYVNLSNEAAVANGYSDMGAYWRRSFESDTFIDDMDKLWRQVKPLYFELHRYVGKKLKERYGDDIDLSDGLIPAHVFGNMWAQQWSSLFSLVKPYPNASEADVTSTLNEQGYSVVRMFDAANEFYMSMSLANMSMAYGEKAMIEKPSDREVLCHASAWDFCDGEDFRIKMCTSINNDDFITIHHELGHIQYYIQYKDQPITLRGGANPGFHEAIGDLIALSVATPKHLQEIGLLSDYIDSDESSINTLMDMALSKVAFLPFGLLIDKWRWDVFSGAVGPEEYNSHWWYYREKYQKVKAPNNRFDEIHFDPGAKYHIPGDSQYISYFVARILQFQLYKALCIAAGEYDPENATVPLHKCDFYRSTAAGQLLSEGLALGAAKHWSETLKILTNETEISASAMLEYFQPLYQYLKEQNGPMTEEELINFLQNDYEEDASSIQNKQVIAEWNYATDIDNATASEAQTAATLETAEFQKLYWEYYFKDLNIDDYTSETVRRQVRKLVVLGTAALDTDKLTELTNAQSNMSNIYSTGKICPYTNQNCDLTTEGLSLEPDIESILSTSTDYDELAYVWKAWRDATGAKMKDYYETYVTLENEAAVANGFSNMGEMWIDDFESDTFVADMDALWEQVKPLYDELHQYVGNKLKERYGDKLDISDGLIPAHVFGNMWAQSWTSLSSLVRPYPDAPASDVTSALVKQGYTVLRMFETSDEFYQSLGLEPNDMSYNRSEAMIEKPADREVLCHASAWDFSDGEDFRIKMCTSINYEDFVTVHHEMGHIEYFILYKDQPITFRTGANPGVHEAVGDLIALSVATPKHLQKIGLYESNEESEQTALNTLMDMALEKVAFLPFGLLIDKWRWDVFNGSVSKDQWNSRWWYYRETIQKVKPPVERSDDTDFDPGAKYHVPGDSQYISYFVAHILQFQLYRSLCKTAGQYDPNNAALPLYNCDFYQSTEVGDKLRAGLSLGSSKHWKEALREITGEDDYDGTAIIEYFQPLYEYLRQQNEATTTSAAADTTTPSATTSAAADTTTPSATTSESDEDSTGAAGDVQSTFSIYIVAFLTYIFVILE